jgi:hypothetical protein
VNGSLGVGVLVHQGTCHRNRFSGGPLTKLDLAGGADVPQPDDGDGERGEGHNLSISSRSRIPQHFERHSAGVISLSELAFEQAGRSKW